MRGSPPRPSAWLLICTPHRRLAEGLPRQPGRSASRANAHNAARGEGWPRLSRWIRCTDRQHRDAGTLPVHAGGEHPRVYAIPWPVSAPQSSSKPTAVETPTSPCRQTPRESRCLRILPAWANTSPGLMVGVPELRHLRAHYVPDPPPTSRCAGATRRSSGKPEARGMAAEMGGRAVAEGRARPSAGRRRSSPPGKPVGSLAGSVG